MSFRHFSADSVPNQGYITYNSYSWSKPASITFPGGTRREYSYNPLMQIKSLIVKDPGQNPFMEYNYQYAPSGNITAKNTEHGNYAYQYDDLYRLKEALNPGAPDETYTYDAVGNRLTSANVTGAWSYNQNNELLSYDNVSNEYDNNGNTTSKTEQTGTTIYTYDVENRLVQVSTPTQTITYYYDPLGRRLWKDVAGNRTYFLYADEGLIGEYDTSGSEIKTYGYEPGSTWTTNPLFQKIGTNYYWYQNDHLTPQKIMDTSGRVVWSATYDSFGNIQITVSEIENNLRFLGQYYDSETGLHYNYHRDYDPEIGRYVEADPIGIQQGNNHLYIYALNNSINKNDPEGLTVKLCSGAVDIWWVPPYLRHAWLKTSTKEAGMGPSGCGDLVEFPIGAQTQICDNTGRKGFCLELKCGIDETCVNNELIIGKSLGPWGLLNNCWSFVGHVINKCFKADAFAKCCLDNLP